MQEGVIEMTGKLLAMSRLGDDASPAVVRRERPAL
jgi:hypothetical protein